MSQVTMKAGPRSLAFPSRTSPIIDLRVMVRPLLTIMRERRRINLLGGGWWEYSDRFLVAGVPEDPSQFASAARISNLCEKAGANVTKVSNSPPSPHGLKRTRR